MYDNNYPNDFGHKDTTDRTNETNSTEHTAYSGTTAGAETAGPGTAGPRQTQQSRGGQYTGGYGGAYGSNTYNYGGYSGASYQGNAGGSYPYGSAYQNHSGGSYNPNEPKKPRKAKGKGLFWKKAAACVGLGLFFGVCAGLGFWAVESATGMMEKETAAASSQQVLPGNQTAEAEQEIKTVPGTEESADSVLSGTAIVTDVTSVVSEAMPSIVSINNKFTEKMSYFGQQLTSEATASGSGIIVGSNDTELLVATNYHVVAEAEELSVQFADGNEATALLKGSDSKMDLAVLAIPLDSISPGTMDAIAIARLGDSDTLAVGEPAIAIGNALGYGQSVTTGVISALNRAVDLSDGSNGTFIQTDAAINPGNSGGALLNVKGEVIGINSNKIGGSAIEGMGYAIPISAAKPIIEDLMSKETKTRVPEEEKGYLGISGVGVSAEMASLYVGMPQGVYITNVDKGTGADEAGLVKGMIITGVNGDTIASMEDLQNELTYHKAGETVELTVMQGSPSGWESKTVSLTLGSKPQQ